MKFTFSQSTPVGTGVEFKVGLYNLYVEDADSTHRVEIGGVQLFLEGEIHYAANLDGVTYATAGNMHDLIRNALAEHGPAGFPHAVKGTYVGIWVDVAHATAGLFCDAQNRRWLYCNETPKDFFGSTRLKDTVARANAGGRLNQAASTHTCCLVTPRWPILSTKEFFDQPSTNTSVFQQRGCPAKSKNGSRQ